MRTSLKQAVNQITHFNCRRRGRTLMRPGMEGSNLMGDEENSAL